MNPISRSLRLIVRYLALAYFLIRARFASYA
jgi:hypothetical protein